MKTSNMNERQKRRLEVPHNPPPPERCVLQDLQYITTKKRHFRGSRKVLGVDEKFFFGGKKWVYPKVPYFFISAEKFMAHSFIQNPKICFFFSKNPGKKNTAHFFCFWLYFFFPKKKFTCHSFNRF